MIVYTTCRDCGGVLHVTDRDTVHPLCEPKPTKLERLLDEWKSAVKVGDTTREAELQQQIETIETQPPRLLDAALKYASWGWKVFPLHPKSKAPATSHGFKDATTDPERIHRWFKQRPDCNIGLPTGHHFDVIDIDLPDGPDTYERMLQAEVIPDVHGQVSTSSGGRHLYIKPLGDGNLTRVLPGVDWRGAGGYVVAPPSTLGDKSWTWITHPSPVITGAGDTFGASI